MDIKSAIVQEFDQEMQNTRKALERFPDGKSDWKPHPKSMSLGRLAGHITDFPNWAFHTLSEDKFEVPADYKPFVPQTQSELLEHFDKNLAEARDALAKASLESFDET